MANTTLTADIIAAKSVEILENELVIAKKVYRGHESDFAKKVNGYKVGETLTIRKPTDFTVRSGATAAIQDVVEGSTTMTVDKQKGIDFEFTSADLSLEIDEMEERILRPAMIQLANQVEVDLFALYTKVSNWVGTPVSPVNSYADFALAPERLDEMGVPQVDRCAILSPKDHWGLLGSQTALYIQDAAKGAYRTASLGMIGGCDTYMSQNVATHTTGTRDNTTPLVKAAGTGVLSTTWAASKDTGYMDLSTDGHDASKTIVAGDVFTIDTVFDVNPVTKATLAHLKMFTVVTTVTSDATTTNETTIRISPPIIASGAQQTVSGAPAAGATITFVGATASTKYRQNLVFTKNAFALVMVPMEKPDGAVQVARKSYKGISARLIPYYDGTNDLSKWRFDLLYGVKCLDPRLAVRLSGTT